MALLWHLIKMNSFYTAVLVWEEGITQCLVSINTTLIQKHGPKSKNLQQNHYQSFHASTQLMFTKITWFLLEGFQSDPKVEKGNIILTFVFTTFKRKNGLNFDPHWR